MVTSNSTQDEIAELFTQDLPSAKEMCVRFWWVQRSITDLQLEVEDWCTYYCTFNVNVLFLGTGYPQTPLATSLSI